MISNYLNFYAFLSKKDGETIDLSNHMNDLGKLDVSGMDLFGTLITNAHTINCKNNKIIAIFAMNAKQIDCVHNNIKFLYAPLLKHLKSDNILEKIIFENVRTYENSNFGISIKEKSRKDRFMKIRGITHEV